MACVIKIRLRQGDAGRKEFRAWLEQRNDYKPGTWLFQRASFLLGNTDEAALLKATESPDANETSGRRCVAWYYAGMLRLAAGQKTEAADCFRKCIATEQKTLTEYALAVAELKWLGEK